jgi:hypothetical protein
MRIAIVDDRRANLSAFEAVPAEGRRAKLRTSFAWESASVEAAASRKFRIRYPYVAVEYAVPAVETATIG